MQKHKIINKNYLENENFYLISASHNGYEKKFGYIHERSIKILKKENKIYGQDILKKTKSFNNSLNYFVRFHIYPDTKIVKTKAGNSVLISLPNGEGWLLECKSKSRASKIVMCFRHCLLNSFKEKVHLERLECEYLRC